MASVLNVTVRVITGCILVAFAVVSGCSESATDPPPPPPPPDPTARFDIEVRPVPGLTLTADQQRVVDLSVERWEEVVVDDLASMQVTRPASDCERVSAPAMDEEVDDLVVWLDFGPLDGPEGAVAWGGVCELRGTHLPAVGSILFDEDDTEIFTTQVIIHEIGHALGFGEVWQELGLLGDPSLPAHGGPGLIEASADATISSGAPDENFGLPGAAGLSTLLVAGASLGEWTPDPDDELQSLIRFDLAGYEFTAPIDLASLILSDSGAVGDGQRILVGIPADGWEETTVTWNSRPSVPDTLTVFDVDDTGCIPFCGVRLRELPQDWVDGSVPNFGVTLFIESSGPPTYGIAFHSRHDPDDTRRPALYVQPRSYFTGPNARSAYLDAGGDPNDTPGVPLENRYLDFEDSVDSHWHPVFVTSDVMGTTGGVGLSTVTVGAMEDMGYGVDYTAADPISLYR